MRELIKVCIMRVCKTCDYETVLLLYAHARIRVEHMCLHMYKDM